MQSKARTGVGLSAIIAGEAARGCFANGLSNDAKKKEQKRIGRRKRSARERMRDDDGPERPVPVYYKCRESRRRPRRGVSIGLHCWDGHKTQAAFK